MARRWRPLTLALSPLAGRGRDPWHRRCATQQAHARVRREGREGKGHARQLALNLFDLRIFQFDRGRAPENRHGNLDPRLLFVNLLDEAVKRGERTVADVNLFADLEGHRRLWPLDPFLDLAHDAHRLGLADRGRSTAAPEKSGDLGGILDEVPSLVAHIHLDQHIAWKEFVLR